MLALFVFVSSLYVALSVKVLCVNGNLGFQYFKSLDFVLAGL